MAKQSLVGRLFNIFRAEGHNLLDSIEDPVKALELQTKQLSEGVNKTESAVAQAIGNLRMMEKDRMDDIQKYEALGRQAQTGMKHAKKAREEGNEAEAARLEELTRSLVTQRVSLEADIRANSVSIDAQTQSVEQLKNNLTQMKDQQKEAIRKKDALIARHVAAETQITVQNTIKSISTIDTNSEMGRLEAKVRKNEAKALGMTEMQAHSSESQLADLTALEARDAVEAKMAELMNDPDSAKFQLTSLDK